MQLVKSLLLSFVLLAPLSTPVEARNDRIASFREAKKLATEVHKPNQVTIYCPCRYSGKTVDLESCGYEPRSNPKRARRIEWEHVVPAHAFGQSFPEWREGAPACVKGRKKFKGRKCAETNPVFAKMEADLHNLWPAIGELNGLRSNLSMAQLGPSRDRSDEFGGCRARIRDRKFEPEDQFKGIVARTYLYMEQAYPGHGIISEKNEKLFAAWDRMYPVSEWECIRAKRIQALQGGENPILKARCPR